MNTSQEQDLGQLLKVDPKGEHRASLVARLTDMQAACATARRSLSDRESFRKLQAASAAVEAAIAVVELIPTRRTGG
jgi:hypothetical protein